MAEKKLEKINVWKRIFNMLKFKPQPSWENIWIVMFGIIFNIAIAIFLGLDNNLSLIIITSVFVEMYLVRKIPLKRIMRSAILFSLFVALALFTASIANGNIYIGIFFFIIWFFIFIILQLMNSPISAIGLFTVFIYFFGAIEISQTTHTINIGLFQLSCIYGIMGLAMVLLPAISMFLIRYLQKDPGKRELLGELFDENISFHKFLENRDSILKSEDSPRNHSLINLAMNFFIAENNIKNLSDSLNLEDQEKFKEFENEIHRLLNKVKKAIIGAYDYDFELNLGNIIEFQKNLEFRLDKIENKSPKQELIDISIKKYKWMFEDLNMVLADKKIIEDIEIHPPYNRKMNIKSNFKLSNINLRYSIKFGIAGVISFIYDVLTHGAPLYTTTLVSGFTLSPNVSNTKKSVILRIISTVTGIILALLIMTGLNLLGISKFSAVLAIISMLLFFVFEKDKQLSIMLLMMGIIFIMPTEEVFSVAKEHLLSTLVGVIIVVTINYTVLPNFKNNNLSKLTLDKIKITSEFIHKTLVEKEDTFKLTPELIKNNHELVGGIAEIKGTYENVDEDMNIYSEICHTLSDLRDLIIGIDMYIDAKKNKL